MAPDASAVLAHCRAALAAHSDIVFGLSEGAIDDIPGAIYLGHGVDTGLELVGDLPPEPADLKSIPHPRALYFGALSVRVDRDALRLLADAGIHIVLVGFAPSEPIAALIASHPNVHFLGPRSPLESPPYLRHCDVGIVPHTDEPFTWTMEPHKVYNYVAAGLRCVLLNCACPPAFADVVSTTRSPQEFVAGVLEALEQGHLPAAQADAARRHTWASVGHEILAGMSAVKEEARS
jgi:glycosyltransferase involved in cell wall biosynthesis